MSDSPKEKILHRLENLFPALGLPRLVAVDHLAQSLADARKRVRDSHAVQMRALDYDVKQGGDDEMGITVTGDTHINVTQAKGSIMGKLATALIGLACGAAPVAALLAWQWFSKPTPQAPANPPADSSYEVLFYDRDGNLITVPHISTKQP